MNEMKCRIRGAHLKTLLASGVALAPLMMSGIALAQEGNATQLERIVVEGGNAAGASATGPVDGYVAKATATGSKTAMPLNEIPQSVSVVGREELDDRAVVNKVDEALRYTPGVLSAPFGTDPDTDWFYIRGFDAAQTGLFLDGLPLFSFGFGNFQVDPFMLERVEVLKGPASVLYGGSNPGGIINLISKRPLDEPLYYTEVGINSNGNAFTGFDVNDKLNDDGTVRYRLTGKVAGGDNYSDYSEDLRGFILPQVTYAPDDATSLTVFGLLQGLDQVHVGNGFLPYVGTVEDAPFGKIDRDAYYSEPDIDEGSYTQQMLGYEFKHDFDNGWTFTQNARYANLHKHEKYPYTYGYVGGAPTGPDYLLNRIGFEATSKVDSFSIDNRKRISISAPRPTPSSPASITNTTGSTIFRHAAARPRSAQPIRFTAHLRVQISYISIRSSRSSRSASTHRTRFVLATAGWLRSTAATTMWTPNPTPRSARATNRMTVPSVAVPASLTSSTTASRPM